MSRIVIVAAKRTPQGRFLGKLSQHSAVSLAMAASRSVLESVPSPVVDQVIIGNVLAAGLGMNIARQVTVKIDLPISTPAYTVNMMCASGMKAVLLGAQAIRSGDARSVLCGGTESMTNAPFVLEKARAGYKLGDGKVVDVILRDGLVDSFSQEHMGVTAERLAAEYAIDRPAQDRFALQSQQRYARAAAAGLYKSEIVGLPGLDVDEHPRSDATLDSLGALKPAFDPAKGTVTAGNASGINDGAAMVLLADEDFARRQGWKPMAVLEASSEVGCDPARMGIGPVAAVEQLCAKLGVTTAAFDAIELNEAFAAQVLSCAKLLGIPADDVRLNPWGGAIAVGHPIGASGARLLVTLAHRVSAGLAERGLAALCVGGGMGVAASVSKP
jgi:acetyl-CoA C-acetyltransferase